MSPMGGGSPISSDDEMLKKSLEKIKKTWKEMSKLDAECSRRQLVAQEKLLGFMIEIIQNERDKLKDKKKLGFLVGIMQRITELRMKVLNYLARLPSGKELDRQPFGGLFYIEGIREGITPTTNKAIVIYNQIFADLSREFGGDESLSSLPSVSRKFKSPFTKLGELDLCLGQLGGFVLGKMFEIFY